MTKYIQITLPVANEAQMELVIALLSPLGFNGFLEEENLLKAYIDKKHYDEEEFLLIINKHNLTYSLSVQDNQNWNAIWEANFEPIQVDDFVGIRAKFHAPIQGVAHELMITPKMSFGTGHHATTYSVMQLMRTVDFNSKWVLDFGTGTGILAILAEKLGACNVLAIDNDKWSIKNAKENVKVNDCWEVEIVFRDKIETDWKLDIILANVNRHIIEAHLNTFALSIKPSGIMILSGLLVQDEQAILTATAAVGFEHITTLQKDGWIAIQFLKS